MFLKTAEKVLQDDYRSIWCKFDFGCFFCRFFKKSVELPNIFAVLNFWLFSNPIKPYLNKLDWFDFHICCSTCSAVSETCCGFGFRVQLYKKSGFLWKTVFHRYLKKYSVNFDFLKKSIFENSYRLWILVKNLHINGVYSLFVG